MGVSHDHVTWGFPSLLQHGSDQGGRLLFSSSRDNPLDHCWSKYTSSIGVQRLSLGEWFSAFSTVSCHSTPITGSWQLQDRLKPVHFRTTLEKSQGAGYVKQDNFGPTSCSQFSFSLYTAVFLILTHHTHMPGRPSPIRPFTFQFQNNEFDFSNSFKMMLRWTSAKCAS